MNNSVFHSGITNDRNLVLNILKPQAKGLFCSNLSPDVLAPSKKCGLLTHAYLAGAGAEGGGGVGYRG